MNSANAAAEAEFSNRVTRAPDAEVHLGDCEGGGGQDVESPRGDTDDADEASEKEYSTSQEEYSTSEESEISDTDSEPAASSVPRPSFASSSRNYSGYGHYCSHYTDSSSSESSTPGYYTTTSDSSDADSEPASPVPRTSFTVSVSAPDASRSDPSASNTSTSQ